MRNFSYNADFFERWFKQSGVQLTQLMSALGVNNSSLDRWMKKKTNPIPVDKMILLCNTYDIDISEFFKEDGRKLEMRSRRSRSAEPPKAAAPPPPASAANEEVLQLKLDHLQELQRVRQEAHDREEALRKDYEKRIEEYREMVRDMNENLRLALARISRLPEGYAGDFSVSEPKKQMGGTFQPAAPFPHVDPKKR